LKYRNIDTKSLGSAIILYCSTLFFASYYIEAATLVILLIFSAVNRSKRSDSHIKVPPAELVVLLVFYALLAFIYIFSADKFSIFESNPVVGIFLLLIAILCSGFLSKNVLFYFLVLCGFESFLAFYQYISGTQYFFEAQLVGRDALNSSDVYGLYSNKSLGLGYSSTQLSAKIIFSLCAYISKGGRPSLLLLSILMVGSLATFSRAGVLCLAIIIMTLIYNRGLLYKILITSLFIIIVLLFYKYLEVIFLKNKSIIELLNGEVDISFLLTGRVYIWEQAWVYWVENLIAGGLGVAQTFKKIGGEANAHNAILYILTKGGILLFIPYILIFRKVGSRIGLVRFFGLFTFMMFGASIGSYLSYYEVMLFSMLYPTQNLNLHQLSRDQLEQDSASRIEPC
jgi:hypothetical protein